MDWDGTDQSYGLDPFEAALPPPMTPTQARANALRTPKRTSTSISQTVQAPTKQPVDPLEARGTQLAAERDELLKRQEATFAKPDYSGYQQVAQQRRGEGQNALLLALAAQEANMEPIQAHYLKRAAAARDPMKVTGGTITDTGFVEDVGHAQELEAKRIDARMRQIDALMQSNISAQERRRLAEEQRQHQIDMRNLIASQRQQPGGQIVTDADGNATLVDTRTGAKTPLGQIGAGRNAGGNVSGTVRKELAEGESTEATLGGAIEALKASSGGGTGWLPGMVQEKLPGGESIASKFRDEGTRNAIQQLTYITDGIRHGRFGSALTVTEKASAAQYLPSPYDSKERLVEKAEGLQNLIAENNRRVRQEFGRSGEPGYGPGGERAPQPGAPKPPAAANAPVQQRARSYYD